MLPNLIIIGAPKAGTTSLYRYLDLHPKVVMSRQKELRYFWRDDWREQRAWYEAQFDCDAPVRGEATPAYAAYPYRPNVPQRMHELVPETKLIYLVRDPIDRLMSHWVQRRANGDLTPFEQYVNRYEDLDNPVVCPSRYWLQIEQYLAFFAPGQLLVISQEDLKWRRQETLVEVFRFLGVDESFTSPDFEIEYNTRAEKIGPRTVSARLWDRMLWPASRRVPRRIRDAIRGPANRLLLRQIDERPVLDDKMRERLAAFLAPEMKALRQFTGKSFSSWSL
jgi:hypothetical protein